MPETSPVAEYDFVIVGAGSAGCLLANRLSANPDHRVLLIEAGGADDWFWIKVPVGYLYTIANPRTDWCFTTEADPGLAGRTIHYARGRVIGGSSSINAMIHMRGQASDYELWARATGDQRWLWGGPDGAGETLSIYKELEDYFGGADEWHGAGGEIPVERPRVRWKILDAWQDAAAQVGISPSTNSTGATTPAVRTSTSINGVAAAGRWPTRSCTPSPTDPTSPSTPTARPCDC